MDSLKGYAALGLVVILVMAALIAGGFFWGRSTVHEEATTVPATIDVGPVISKPVEGTVDSVTYSQALERIRVLERLAGRPWPAPDTVYISPEAGEPPVYHWRGTDTSTVTVAATLHQGEDTLSAETRTQVTLDAELYGPPVNRFYIRSLALRPFGLAIPVKEKVRDELPLASWNTFFSLDVLGGYGTNIGVGAYAHIGWLGAGVIMPLTDPKEGNRSPFYFAGARLVGIPH
jgi:hypothetical protein